MRSSRDGSDPRLGVAVDVRLRRVRVVLTAGGTFIHETGLVVTDLQNGSYVVRGRCGKTRVIGRTSAFISYLANFANCVLGIIHHRIGKMHTLGRLRGNFGFAWGPVNF
jgi:hypothetical protein